MNASVERIIAVVGAAGGIGSEVVRQLPAGTKVIAVVQNQEQIQQVSALAWRCVECNLADAASVDATVSAINEMAPDLHGLVFCAAMQPVGPIELVKRTDLEKLFAINVFGTLQLVQGMIPALRRAQGRIVLLTSMAGRFAPPMLGAYAGTKFCLEGMSDALRRELRLSGVTLSLIEPGGVDTPMAAAQPALIEQALGSLNSDAMQRYGALYRGYLKMVHKGMRMASKPGDVARIAVHAVTSSSSPKARYVVGTDAKFLIQMSNWLPWRWFDALMIKLTLGS